MKHKLQGHKNAAHGENGGDAGEDIEGLAQLQGHEFLHVGDALE